MHSSSFHVLLVSLAVAPLSLTLLHCGSDDKSAAPAAASSSSAQLIDAHGGTFQVDGVTVTVPDGAVSAPTSFSVRRGASPSYPLPPGVALCSDVQVFGPDGITFAKPVTVELPHRCSEAATAYWSTPAKSGYAAAPTVTQTADRITFTVTHFSEGFVGQPVTGQETGGAGGVGGAGGAAGAGGNAGAPNAAGAAGGTNTTVTVVPPPDRDGDGVPDASDACPDVSAPGQANGCPPPPPDRDGDGVPDASDACPDVSAAGQANGCPPPPPDRDGDGVPDASDACPDMSAPGQANGCPPPPATGQDAARYTCYVVIGTNAKCANGRYAGQLMYPHTGLAACQAIAQYRAMECGGGSSLVVNSFDQQRGATLGWVTY